MQACAPLTQNDGGKIGVEGARVNRGRLDLESHIKCCCVDFTLDKQLTKRGIYRENTETGLFKETGRG